MTPHINAKPGQISETVLMPGDPLRAKWVAETFLENAECVNNVRGMLGFTGSYKGHPVTVHGSGMGMPSMSIYANELIQFYGAQTLIRIGSCGAMQENIKLRDIVLAMTASTLTSPSQSFFHGLNYAPCADFDLLRAAHNAAQAKTEACHCGPIYSSDLFYSEHEEMDQAMMRHGILAVEMEAAELYTVAARHKRRALAVLTVSDHIITQESLPSEDRERSFASMVEIALQAAFS